MAKVKAYLKVGEIQGKRGEKPFYRILASAHPDDQPITHLGKDRPTARFALELDIPDSRFREAERVLAEVKIAESTQVVNVELVGEEDGTES